ncbi:MAG TPA: NADH-quinone oxidoreductase subunit E, partial [Chloroflexota bacterium]|nr:NADH-quinone oxidoreductase subunit E [Chloroflexota bacterium]
MSADWLAPLPVAVPLLTAAVLVGGAPLWREPVASALGVLAALVTTLCCGALLVQASQGTLVYWFGGWQPHDGVALGISFVIDPLGAGMA